MSQPTPAYQPAPGQQPGYGVAPGAEQPAAPAFRPASGWQFGEQPAPATVARPHPVVTAMLVTAAYLVMLQGVVSIVTVNDPAPDAIVRAAFTWLAGGAALAVLLSLPSRSVLLLTATGIVAFVDAIAYVVLGVLGLTGAADHPVVAVALLLSATGAVVGVVSVAATRPSLMTLAIALAALGVVTFYAISVVAPIVMNGVASTTIVTVLRTVLVAALAVVAGILLHRARGSAGVLAGIALGAFGVALTLSPIVSAVLGSPPPAAALVLVVVRVALVLVAAALVVVHARRP